MPSLSSLNLVMHSGATETPEEAYGVSLVFVWRDGCGGGWCAEGRLWGVIKAVDKDVPFWMLCVWRIGLFRCAGCLEW